MPLWYCFPSALFAEIWSYDFPGPNSVSQLGSRLVLRRLLGVAIPVSTVDFVAVALPVLRALLGYFISVALLEIAITPILPLPVR